MTYDTSGSSELEELMQKFFSQAFPPSVVAEVEEDGLSQELWQKVADLGLPVVALDEEAGGSGGTVRDLVIVLQAMGRHAAPVPLGETHLAAWLLHAGGLGSLVDESLPPLTVVPDASGLMLRGGHLHGDAGIVPWIPGAERLVALVEVEPGRSEVFAIAPGDVDESPGRDLAGMPAHRVTMSNVPAERGDAVEVRTFQARGALIRAAQMAGAIAGAFELTRSYAEHRAQFGRAIGSNQSVQTHVVNLAEATVLTALSVERAAAATAAGNADLQAFAAKYLANRQAVIAVAAAHQVHGAIGMTREYHLQNLTRRLNAWRWDFGADDSLLSRIGSLAAGHGSVYDAAVGADLTPKGSR